jgi:hypothetical protein
MWLAESVHAGLQPKDQAADDSDAFIDVSYITLDGKVFGAAASRRSSAENGSMHSNKTGTSGFQAMVWGAACGLPLIVRRPKLRCFCRCAADLLLTCAWLTSPPRSPSAHQRLCRPFATTASTAAAFAAPSPQATSLFGARLSEKRQVQLHSPWLKWLPKALAILADRGFRNCQRFYGNFNRCVVPVWRRSECGCCFRVVGHCA